MEIATFQKWMMKVAVALSRELDEATVSEYWEIFQAWPDADFESAMAACQKTCAFFPSPHRIIQERPIKRTTIEDIDRRNGIDKIEDEVKNPPTADLEDRIDNLTDEELFDLFRPFHDNSAEVERSAAFSVNQFRAKPQGVYRGVVRDLLRKKERWETSLNEQNSLH